MLGGQLVITLKDNNNKDQDINKNTIMEKAIYYKKDSQGNLFAMLPGIIKSPTTALLFMCNSNFKLMFTGNKAAILRMYDCSKGEEQKLKEELKSEFYALFKELFI